MTAWDRNKKELGVGDEVVVYFKINGFEAKSDGEVVNAILETIHIPRVEGAENPKLIFDAHPTMTILQRKAKPSAGPATEGSGQGAAAQEGTR